MSRTVTLRAIGGLLVLGALFFAWTQQAPPDLTVEKVADDLHIIVGSGGNVAVYTTNDGVILVDDKFEQNHAQILAKVKSITDKPIRYVLNTHQHGDHTGGNQKLLDGKAEILIHRNARANMVSNKQPGLPQITFADETSVFLGDKEVRARHFGRGHTNGDAIVFFPARRVIHTGDLFVGGAPFIDYSSGGSGVAWTETLKAALKLEFDTVIPGHGPVMKRADLEKWIHSFEGVRSKYTEMRRAGKSKEETMASVKLEDFGWASSPNWVQRSAPGLYDEVK